MMYNFSFDDLTFIVCAANLAGQMEAHDKINVPDDDHLTDTCLKIWQEYEKLSESKAPYFVSYAWKRLKEIYG